jgi:hypothetical protein
MFKSQFGSMLPARVYTRDSASSHFKVTVVDYNNIEAISTERSKSCRRRGDVQGRRQFDRPRLLEGGPRRRETFAQWQFMQRDAKITYSAGTTSTSSKAR